MTVNELIAKLQSLPEDAKGLPVMTWNGRESCWQGIDEDEIKVIESTNPHENPDHSYLKADNPPLGWIVCLN